MVLWSWVIAMTIQIHQNQDFQPTLYKFIVSDSLGLCPHFCWVWAQNCDLIANILIDLIYYPLYIRYSSLNPKKCICLTLSLSLHYTFLSVSLLATTLPPPWPSHQQHPKKKKTKTKTKSHSCWTLLNNTTIVIGMNV